MRIVSDSEAFRHLVGRRIDSIYESDMPMVGVGLDDGTTIIVAGTEGCGGCANGYLCPAFTGSLRQIVGGIIMNATIEDHEDRYGDRVNATLFVWVEDKKMPLLDMEGYDNGYYGLGYAIGLLEAGEPVTRRKIKNLSSEAYTRGVV